MYKYIETVLSHIKRDRNKRLIEYELFDHIDEHQKFFEEIGYDEFKSIEKAEERMGDADIVGEQFKARMKHRKTVNIIITIMILAVTIAIYLFFHYNNLYFSMSYSQLSLFMIDKAMGTIVGFFGIVFGLVAMLLGFKRKSIFISTYGYVFSSLLVLFIPKEWMYGFSKSNVLEYYLDSVSFTAGVIKNNLDLYIKIMLVLIIAVLSITFAFGINNIIKAKKLKNSRTDLKLSKVANVLIVILITASISVVGSFVYSVEYYEEEFIKTAQSEMIKANEYIVSISDKLFEENDNGEHSNSEILMQGLKNYEYQPDCDGETLFSPTNLVRIDLYDFSGEVRTHYAISHPFSSLSKKSIDLPFYATIPEIKKDLSINDVSMLCELILNDDRIQLNYDDQYEKYVSFIFDKETKEFIFADSSEIVFDQSVDITNEQKLSLEKQIALDFSNSENSDGVYDYDFFVSKECFADFDEDESDAKSSLGLYPIDCAVELFDVKYNKELDLYCIICRPWTYSPNYYKKENDSFFVVYDCIYSVLNYNVKLDGDNAKILNCRYEDDDSNYNTLNIDSTDGRKAVENLIVENIKEKHK